MIGYITVGTNDMARAKNFYESLFAEIGAKRFMDMDSYVAWSVGQDKPGFCIAKPFDGKAATVGNGVMIALVVDSKAKVDALYKKAIELGGTDEGAPGPRGEGFYAGYFRDLDGNKLNFFTMG
ncbi:MAG: VOC family protein [Burkholderiaceae bacterium]|nr:VOC family protein [Burkholderiaceae bacterium]